jgi:hypothetical protein
LLEATEEERNLMTEKDKNRAPLREEIQQAINKFRNHKRPRTSE